MRFVITIIFVLINLLGFANLDSALYYQQNDNYIKAQSFYIEWQNTTTDTLSREWFEANLNLAKCYRVNGFLSEGLLVLEKGIEKAVRHNFKYSELKHRIYLSDYFLWIEELRALKYSNLVKIDELENYPDLKTIYLHRRAALYNVLAKYFDDSRYADTAYSLAENSLLLAKKIDFKDAQATAYNELADLNESAGFFNLSLQYYDSAAYIFKQENKLVDYVNVGINRSRLFLKLNQLPEVDEILNKVIPIAELNNWYFHLYPLYDTKKKYYLALGDSLNYYKYWVINVKHYNNYIRKRTESELLKVQTQFDLKDKERVLEIRNQAYKTEKAKKQRLTLVLLLLIVLIIIIILFSFFKQRDAKKLEKLLKENQFLLGESNHRIKNNLQLIVSLLARETIGQEGKEISKLQEIASKVESISTLHRQLYTKSDKKSANLKEYVNDIVENFIPFFEPRNVSCKTNVELEVVEIEKAIYIGLLLVELIMNSLKYAFNEEKDSPEILIDISESPNKMTITYSDNGVGVKEGTTLKLISTLSRQLDGEFFVENKNGFYYQLTIAL
jgi:two-component sensor histidine kinase